MIKKLIILFLAVPFLFIFASCAKSNIAIESETSVLTDNSTAIANNTTEEEILALIDNETDSSDLITQSYSIDLLRNREWSTGLEEVNKVANIECIRKVDDLVYTIHKIKQGGELFLFYEFDEESKSWITRGSWYFLKPLYKEDFSKVEIGKTTVKDIGKINNTTALYPTGDGYYSEHILSERSVILIYYDYDNYDDEYIVKSIDYECVWLDPICKKILDIDWPV